MKQLVVVGNGMVGHRFVEAFTARGGLDDWEVSVLGEEPRPAYDRVALSTYFDGASADMLSMVPAGFYDRSGLVLHLSTTAAALDRAARTVSTADGRTLAYDALVLATGSRPFVPPLPGHDAPGCFVYRTLEDLDEIRAYAAGRSAGIVVGGGLLGLEAANALRSLGLATQVVEMAPRLMPIQVDEPGGATLRRIVESKGLAVHCAASTAAVHLLDGRTAGVRMSDDSVLAADLVVFSAGVRPRADLAASGELTTGPRGGFAVDATCRTEDERIWAIGECAAVDGVAYGLVAPGYTMAEIVADRLLGGQARFDVPDLSTKLKLLGVDVASFGDAHARTEGALEVRVDDPVGGIYKKLVVSADGSTLLGGILVGDAAQYPLLAPMVGRRLRRSAASLLAPESTEGGGGLDVTDLPDEATVCSCNAVSKGAVCAAVAQGCHGLAELKKQTRAGTGCGSCVPLVERLRRHQLTEQGVEVSNALCEHFDLSRQEVYDLVRVHGYASFAELLAAHGRSRGCEICRPVAASVIASVHGGYILSGDQAAIQDSNDHLLANIQKDGTYSVVPRVPGGEITPAKLAVLAAVAADFGLYVKITGGQRIDLLGARLEQLPPIWRRLVDAGFESGHAYGKSFRTMKSCVGSTWCRYGVQDSVGLAIALEKRYRGLRTPHKFKGAVSGCARECAEAQSKDIGIIATEKGWNLYVGGNGGMRPQHAKLLAPDLDAESVVRYVDRFLLFYVQTADRLERTANWLNRLEGGLEHVRRVVVQDSLGMATEWDAHMQRLADSYECEWRRTLEDPDALAQFVPFLNAPEATDPDVVFVTERDQPRPATESERAQLIAGARLEVVTA